MTRILDTEIHRDGNRQKYVNVANIRITIRHANDAESDWERLAATYREARYLNMRAYKGEGDKLHNFGPEVPIENDNRSDEEILRSIQLAMHFATS